MLIHQLSLLFQTASNIHLLEISRFGRFTDEDLTLGELAERIPLNIRHIRPEVTSLEEMKIFIFGSEKDRSKSKIGLFRRNESEGSRGKKTERDLKLRIIIGLWNRMLLLFVFVFTNDLRSKMIDRSDGENADGDHDDQFQMYLLNEKSNGDRHPNDSCDQSLHNTGQSSADQEVTIKVPSRARGTCR